MSLKSILEAQPAALGITSKLLDTHVIIAASSMNDRVKFYHLTYICQHEQYHLFSEEKEGLVLDGINIYSIMMHRSITYNTD